MEKGNWWDKYKIGAVSEEEPKEVAPPTPENIAAKKEEAPTGGNWWDEYAISKPAVDNEDTEKTLLSNWDSTTQQFEELRSGYEGLGSRYEELSAMESRTPEQEKDLQDTWNKYVNSGLEVQSALKKVETLQPEVESFNNRQKQKRVDYIESQRGSAVFGNEVADSLYEIDARADLDYEKARAIPDKDKRKEAFAKIRAGYQTEETQLLQSRIDAFKENEAKIGNAAEVIGQAFSTQGGDRSSQTIDQFLLETSADVEEYAELRDSLLNQDDPEKGKLFREASLMNKLAEGIVSTGVVNGEVRISPSAVWNAELVKQEIAELDVSDAQKQLAIASIPRMQEEAAKLELPFLQKVNEFNAFVKKNNLQGDSPKDQISEWKSRTRNWSEMITKAPAQVGIGLTQGALGLLEAGQAIVGGTAMTMGAQKFADPFLDAATQTSERNQELGRISQEIGGPTLLAELAAVAPQIALQIGIGKTVSFGGSKLGLKPKMVSNLGFGSSVGTAMAQSYGNVLSSAFQQLEKEKIDAGMDPIQARAEAVKEAQLPAALSGLSTAIVTAVGGKRGVESPFNEGVDSIKAKLNTAAFRAELPRLIPDVIKGMRNEGYEELADQLAQGIIEQFTFNPELKTSDIINNAVKALVIGGITGGTVEGLKYGFDYMRAPKEMARREASMASIRQSITDAEKDISAASASSPIGGEFQREYDATLPSDEAAKLGAIAVDRTKMSSLQAERQELAELLEDETISKVARNQLEGKLAAADVAYYNEVLAPMRRNVVNEQLVDQLDGMVVSQQTKDSIVALSKIANGLGAESLTGRERVAVGITSIGEGKFLSSKKNPMVEVGKDGRATVTEAGRLMAENVGMVPLVRMIGLSESTRAKQAEMERIVNELEAKKAQQGAKDTAESEDAKRYGPASAEALKQQVAAQPPAGEKDAQVRMARLLKEQEEVARKALEALQKKEVTALPVEPTTPPTAVVPADDLLRLDTREELNRLTSEGMTREEAIEDLKRRRTEQKQSISDSVNIGDEIVVTTNAKTGVTLRFKIVKSLSGGKAIQQLNEKGTSSGPELSLDADAGISGHSFIAGGQIVRTEAAPPTAQPNLEPLRRVTRAEQTPEDVAALTETGLIEIYKDQPVLTQAGIDALPEAERPRLNPEARKIQIDTGANEVVAEAIFKGLRIGVDQVGPNVRMPQGWTLDGDIYIPPAPVTEPPVAPPVTPLVQPPVDELVTIFNYDERVKPIQDQIDNRIDELEAGGMTFEDANKDPSVLALYEQRYAMDRGAINNYRDIVNKAFSDQGITNDNLGFTPASSISKSIYGAPSRSDEGLISRVYETGQRAFNDDKATIKKLSEAIFKYRAENEGLDPAELLGPNSGLTDEGKKARVDEARTAAEAIHNQIKSSLLGQGQVQPPVTPPVTQPISAVQQFKQDDVITRNGKQYVVRKVETGGGGFLYLRVNSLKNGKPFGRVFFFRVDDPKINLVQPSVTPLVTPPPIAPTAGAITEEQANNVVKTAQEERAKKNAPTIEKSDWGPKSVPPKAIIGGTARQALITVSRLNLSKIAQSNPNEILMQDVAAILAELKMPILDLESVATLSSLRAKGRPRRWPGIDSVIGMPSTIPMPVEVLVHEMGHTLTADQIRRYLPRKKTGSGKAYFDALNKAIADPKTPEAVSRLFSLYVSAIDQLGITEQYFGAKGVAGTPKADTSKAMAKRLQAKGLLRKDLKGSDLYGLANVEEFVSQTFSEPSFRNILKGLKDPTNPQRTLWQAFVDAVQAILQLPKGSMAAGVIQASVDVGMTVPSDRALGQGRTGTTPAPVMEAEAEMAYAGEQANVPQFMRDSLSVAQAMAAKKADPETIRNVTGWIVNPYDGKLRWEIPDNNASLTNAWDNLKESPIIGTPIVARLGDILSHPQLFKAYPDIADVTIVKRSPFLDFFRSIQGSYDDTTNQINVTPYATDPLSTLLHEIQHWIQNKEGFARGSNTETVMKVLTPNQKSAIIAEMISKADDMARLLKDKLEEAWKLRDHLRGIQAMPDKIVAFDLAAQEKQRTDAEWSRAYNTMPFGDPVRNAAYEAFDAAKRKLWQAAGIDPDKALETWNIAYPIVNAESFDQILNKAEEDFNKLEKDISSPYQILADASKGDDKFKVALDKFGLTNELYRRVAGEIEARDVQSRAGMTPEERAASEPYSSQNIAPELAIVTFTSPSATTEEVDIDMAPEAEAQPFYSQLQRVVGEKMPNVSSPQQIKAIIDPSRGSGVKPEEVKWSGITEAIDRIASENNGRVPKEEILKYLRDEGAVKFEEVRMSDAAAQNEMRLKRFRDSQKVMRDAGIFVDVSSTGEVLLRDKYSGPPNVDPENLPPELRREYETLQDNAIEDRAAERIETRYSKYQLEGGTNYREVVMAMPSVETAYEIYRSDNGKLLKTVPESNLEVELNESRKIQKMADNDPAIVKSRKTDKKVQSKNLYTSTTHYPNVPNYVAHMRLNDRKDSDGRDGTFIEEIQSDRHQAGREKGYREDQIGKLPKNWSVKQRGESWIVVDEYGEQIGPLQSTEEAAMQEGISQANFNDINVPSLESGGIPDAPFRKDWPLQMFKRALQEAVASGKEWIGWTTGEMQAARYDLSKQVDALDYQKNQDGTYQLSFQKNQRGNMVGEAIPANKLEEYVGKEVAEKIIEGAGNDVNFAGNNEPQNIFKRLAGLDLKIGGEGMKGFYDNILPKEIAKYVKKWGATVEKSVVMVDPSNGFYVRYEDGVSQIGNPAVFGVETDGERRIVNQNFSNQEAAKKDAAEKNRQLQEGTPIWRVNITPEMEESVTNVGQPLFSTEEEFDIVPEQVEDQIEGTPEAAVIKVMGQAFQMANEQSAAAGTPQGTIPLETITSAWMNSGRDVETLENAIIRYTNLDPEVAATFAEAISQQVEIQRGIMEIADAARSRKAEQDEEPEIKPYSFAQRIKGELPPEIRSKVQLVYEVLRNDVSVQEANQAMSGLTVDEAIRATEKMDNGISMPVRSMMAQIVFRKILAQRKATKGKKGKEADYAAILDAHVEFFNWFSEYSKELGQGIQAIARFSDLGADGMLLKVKKSIEKATKKHITNRRGQIDKIKRDVEEADSAAFKAALNANKGSMDATADKAGKQEAKMVTIEEQAQKLAQRAAKKVAGEEIRRRQPDPLSELVNGHLRRYNANFVAEATAMGVSPATAQAIEDSAIKLRDSRQSAKAERELFKDMQDERLKVKKELARENKYIYGERPTIWEDYQEMFSERLARRLMRDPKKKIPPSLLLFTDRLTENLLGFVPEAKRQATTQRSFQAMIEDALNNKEKYQEAFNKAMEDISLKVMELEARAGGGEAVSSSAYKKALAAQEFMERLEPIIQQFPVSDKLIIRFVNQKTKAIGESITAKYNQWGRSSKKTRSEIEMELAQKLVEDINVSDSDAIKLSRAIIKDFRAKAEERREKALARFRKPKEKSKRLKESPLKTFFELINIGAMTDEDAYAIMAHRFELPTWDAKFAKQIDEMANIIQDMPEGLARRKMTRNMMAEIARKKGFSLSDLGAGFAFSNMLSGAQTFLINLQDTLYNNFLNGFANSIADGDFTRMNGLVAGYRKGWLEAVQVFNTGLRINMPRLEEKTPLTVELTNYGKKGGVALESNEGMNAIAKTLLESPIAWPLNAWTYVTRIMEATDALNYVASSEGQRYAEAAKIAKDEGLKGREKTKRVNQILNLGDDVYQAALKQAEKEGYTGVDLKFRAMEIQDGEIDAGLRERSFDRALVDVYRNMPTGVAGYLAATLNGFIMKWENPFIRNSFKLLLAPFVITPTNVFNRWLDWSPYGYKRMFFGSGNFFDKDGPYYVAPPKKGSAEFYTQLIKASSSLVVTGMAEILVRTGLLIINGMGPSDEEERKQWLADGNRPHTFSFMGGPQFSYQYTPWALPLSWLANVRNWSKYQSKEDTSYPDRILAGLLSMTSVIMDLPFFAGPADFLEAIQSKRSSDLSDAVGKYVEGKMGMVFPSFIRHIDQIFDPTVYDSRGIKGVILDQTPFARRLGNQRVNLFGDPIGEDKPTMDRLIGRIVSSPVKPSRESLILAKYDIYPYMPSPQRARALVDGEEAQMTEEQYNKFVKIVGSQVKQEINGMFDPEGEVSETEMKLGKKRISQIFEKARARGVREVSY